MSGRPGWIQLGAGVAYFPHQDSEEFYVGVVDSLPRLLGGTTWVVSLRDMDPTYRDGQRRTVPAAVCDRLKPYDLTAEYARLRDEHMALWAADRRESIMREALKRIRDALADGEPEPNVLWQIANGAIRAADALTLGAKP